MPSPVATDFVPISVGTLTPAALQGISLYLYDEDTEKYVLYRDAELAIHESDLQRLRERGVMRLFIEKESKEAYREYLRHVAFTDADADVSVQTSAIAEIIRDVLQNSFESGSTDNIIQSANTLGNVASKLVQSTNFTSNDLLNVLHHDYGTFTHSTNVGFYAGMLAGELGYASDDINKIVVGALLHDLGKLEIDEKILCKPGKLTDLEYRVIKRHPLTGFLKLAQRKDLAFGQLMMVYQHHERLDGKGYPVGLHDIDIHPWAKITSVVDVYEALTSNRPYRTSMPTNVALNILHQDAGKAFDPDLVKCWTQIIQKNLKK